MLIVILFVFVAIITISFWEQTNSITDDVIAHVSTCKFLAIKLRYLSDRFILSGNFNTYREYRTYRRRLLSSLEELVAMFSKFDDSPLASSFSTLRVTFMNVFLDFNRVFRVQDIGFVLACNHYQIPSSLTPELDGIDWDIATEENSHQKIIQQQQIPLTQRYTNKTYDLARQSTEQILLAQHITMGRHFLPVLSHAMVNYLLEPINYFVFTSVTFLEALRNPTLFTVFRGTLFVTTCITVIVFLYILMVITTPKRKMAGHVKQLVELTLVNKFHNQSITALACMAVGITVFFSLAIYATFVLQSWPNQLQLAGERAKIPYAITGRVLQAAMNPTTREESCTRIRLRADQLLNTHNELLYHSNSPFLDSAAARFPPQSDLVFHTHFNILTYNTSVLQQFGLNFLLNRFISLLTPLMLQETTASWEVDSPHIQEIIQVGHDLASLCLDSLDLLQEELQHSIRFYRIAIILSMVLVLCISVLIHVFLFRKMLNTLSDEEGISLQLISMIPQSVVDSSHVIQQFVVNS
ncbi:hypothetical protein GEMRC1_014124 [Eukaryota sp. GEM-RC1]